MSAPQATDVGRPDALWITGAGLVTAVGASRDATFRALVRGERGIRPVSLFDTSGQRSALAAEVRDVELPKGSAREAAAWSRTSAMALSAAREAIAEAQLDVRGLRVGLVVGATTGGMFETEALLAELYANPDAHAALLAMLSHPLTSTGDRLAETIGPFARVRTLCSACSSGANALVVAATWLLAGEVDAVVAGGADGLCQLTFTGFNALGAIDTEPCRPFDRRRRGLSLGEGAGFVVMERATVARARSARPIAELAGWALGAEAHHITNPEPRGDVVTRLIERAIARSGVPHIDYVNAHGTATLLNDPLEATALRHALGDALDAIPVSSSKGHIGHTLGAAGAIEAVITAMAIERGVVPPTAGLEEPDPECALLHVMGAGRETRVRAALSSSFGFGGMDTVLVLAAPDAANERVIAPRRAVVVTGAAALVPTGLLASREAAALLDAPVATAASIETSAIDAALDPTRARRLDRAARMAAVAVEHAMSDAAISADAVSTSGVVLGSAFGSVDASAAFMHRYLEKGARFASPADFPNLVPSSPAGHVSIYLGLRGPVFATADLATSGESAFAQAVELVASGEAPRVVAGAFEERSGIVERILATLFARTPAPDGARRAEGAGAIVVESSESASSRGAHVLARVECVVEWRELESGALGGLAAPRDPMRACVVLVRENGGVDALLDASSWRACARQRCEAGEHEALGAIAIAAAVGRLARGDADEALVVGLARGRGYAIVLAKG